MAFSVSLTKATITTSSTLFSKLLLSTHSRSLKTDVNIQSLIDRGRSLLAEVKEAVDNNDISSELLEVFNWHPFLREGPKCPYETKIDGCNLYARIDMPGVGKEGAKVWMEKDYLYFEGEVVDKKPENGDVDFVRKYSSSINLPPSFFETDKVKCVVKNGVVWIVVPRQLKFGDLGTFSPVKVEFC